MTEKFLSPTERKIDFVSQQIYFRTKSPYIDILGYIVHKLNEIISANKLPSKVTKIA